MFNNLKFIFLILLLISTIKSIAQNAILIKEENGTETVFLLKDNPKIILSLDEIILETESETFYFKNNIICEFFNYDTSHSATIYKDNPIYTLSNIKIDGDRFTPNSVIKIIDFNGVIKKFSKINPSGSFTLDISDLKAGIYLFVSDNITFKFIKK